MKDRSITICCSPLDNKVCKPAKTVLPARLWGMDLAYLGLFQAAVLLGGACCLLTGCNNQTQPSLLAKLPTNAPSIALEDLKPESDEADFALFFSQHKADDIWARLCSHFADHHLASLTLNASILDSDQELNSMLSQYEPLVQQELRRAIELSVHHKKQELRPWRFKRSCARMGVR